MRIVTDEKDRQAYKEFLEKHERCNFQQSPEWAKVKGNWINEIVLAEDESGKIIGAVSILIRKIPIFGNIMYSSRGPTCDIHDISVMKQLTDGIKELAKKYKAIVYKAEPDILSSDEEYRKIVTSLGYKIKDDAKNFREEIQPRYVFRLDIKNKTEDEIFAGFHSKTRYNVRLAIKKGVEVKEGTREDLKDFHKIMIETGNRDGFITRPLSYFEKMYDELARKKGFRLIGDIKMPLLVSAVDIGESKEYIFTNCASRKNIKDNYITEIGIGRAVRASSSFPAIFCPCEYKNHIFMDGGVLNNLPTEELKKVYTGKIISVNFESDPVYNDYDIMNIIMKTLDIMGNKLSINSLKKSDFVLTVPTDGTGLIDVDKMDICYKYGYEIAIKNIDKIRKMLE